MARAPDIPLHGPFYDAPQVLVDTSTAFGTPNCVVRPILPHGRIRKELSPSLPPPLLPVWFTCYAVRLLKPTAFMSREEREQLAEDHRSGIPLHGLDNSLYGDAYFAGVRRPTYIARPPRALLPALTRRCSTYSSSAPTSKRRRIGSCGCGWSSINRGLLPHRAPQRCC